MTNEELKLEAIKKAYGEYWDLVGDYVDVNGYLQSNDIAHHNWKCLFSLPLGFYVFHEGSLVRPKSLSGIENNNSWIKIEEDGSNLPKSFCECRVISKINPDKPFSLMYAPDEKAFENDMSYFKFSEISHYYIPFANEEPPVY